MSVFVPTRMCGCKDGGYTTATLTGNTNDWIVPTTDGKPASLVRISTASDVTLSGIVPSLTDQSLVIYVQEDSPGAVTLTSEDPASGAINRISTPTGGPLRISQGQSVILTRQYLDDGVTLRWVAMSGTAPSYDSSIGTPQVLAATENNLALTSPAPIVPLQPTANSSITGLEWPVPGPGEITFWNDSNYSISLPSSSSSSASANRWNTPGGVTLLIPPGGIWQARNDPGLGIVIVGGASAVAPGAITLPRLSTTPANAPSGEDTYYNDASGNLSRITSSGSVSAVGGGARTEGTLAAAGTNQATAAQMTTDAVVVTGGNSSNGVKLPNTVAGIIVVYNGSGGAFTINVYPPTGAIFQGAATFQVVTDGTSHVFFRVSSTQWISAHATV